MSTDIIARGLAAAQARSGTTQALVRALRKNGFHPQPSYRCPTNDQATITVPAGGANSVITGGASTSANVPVTNTGKITWLGGVADKDVNATYYARGSWMNGGRDRNYNSYEFNHTGTQFEVQVTCGNLSGGTFNFRVLVNDRVAGTAFVTGDSANRLIRVQFPTSATRRVRIEMAGGRHRGLNVAAPSEVTATGRSYPLVTLIGDSFVAGTGADTPINGEGIAAIRALGFNCALGGTGGTGVLNPGGGGLVNWQNSNRLSDLAQNGFTDQISNATPDVAMGVIMLSINDNGLADSLWGGATSYQEAYAKGLWVLVDHWQAQRPGKPLVIMGPTSIGDTPQLDAYRMRDAAQEVVQGAGGAGANLWFIDRYGPSTLLRKGTKTTVALTGTLTSGSKIVTGLSSTSSLGAYVGVTGTGIPTGARVMSIDSSTQVTLDIAATASGAQSLTFQTDQAAYYTSSDGTHPNQVGHNYDALWAAAQLRDLILTRFA